MTAEPEFIMVSTTTDEESKAAQLAGLIVENRLAACVQYMPIKSVYRWKGTIESESEYLLLAKTEGRVADELIAFIGKNHSYDEPEIVVTPIINGSKGYLDWISGALKIEDY